MFLTLSAEYVSEAHFGGFLTRSDLEFAEGKSNTRKEWIDNMISESRKRKAERQKDHADTVNMTVDLDKKWKSLMPSLKSSGAIYTKKEDVVAEEQDTDPYNVLMRELAFEVKRGQAQERLKTEEELIEEERERLEKLEADRIRRMKGGFDAAIDADDVDDDDHHDESEAKPGDESDDGDAEEESGGEEEEEEEKEGESHDEDAYSDLEESEDDDDNDDKGGKSVRNKHPDAKKDRKKEMEEAAKQIPFTFKVPETYEGLLGHFENRSPVEKSTILERMIKCNHPQFGDDNKSKLETLFALVLQHLHDCASDEEPEDLEEGLATVQKLSPFLFDLAKFFPAPAAKSILSVLQEKYEEYQKNVKAYPTLETVRNLL